MNCHQAKYSHGSIWVQGPRPTQLRYCPFFCLYNMPFLIYLCIKRIIFSNLILLIWFRFFFQMGHWYISRRDQLHKGLICTLWLFVSRSYPYVFNEASSTVMDVSFRPYFNIYVCENDESISPNILTNVFSFNSSISDLIYHVKIKNKSNWHLLHYLSVFVWHFSATCIIKKTLSLAYVSQKL